MPSNEVWGNVIFSQVFVCLRTGEGGGWFPTCITGHMTRGLHPGGSASRRCLYPGGCLHLGCLHAGGSALRGVCIEGGLH